MPQFTRAEVLKHSSNDDCWIIIDGKVYDVTKFMFEHPGGEEVLRDMAGQDATESFNDVGHSADAKEMTKDYYVGDVVDDAKGMTDDSNAKQPNIVENSNVSWKEIIFSPTWSNFIIPVGIAALVYITYKSAQRLFPSI